MVKETVVHLKDAGNAGAEMRNVGCSSCRLAGAYCSSEGITARSASDILYI